MFSQYLLKFTLGFTVMLASARTFAAGGVDLKDEAYLDIGTVVICIIAIASFIIWAAKDRASIELRIRRLENFHHDK